MLIDQVQSRVLELEGDRFGHDLHEVEDVGRGGHRGDVSEEELLDGGHVRVELSDDVGINQLDDLK